MAPVIWFTHPEADVVEGCCTYILNAGMARAGTDFNVTFHYVKDLQNTEFEALVVSPVTAVDENTEGRTFYAFDCCGLVVGSSASVAIIGRFLLLVVSTALYQ